MLGHLNTYFLMMYLFITEFYKIVSFCYYAYVLNLTPNPILGYNSRDWSFNDWNSWRQADGFLCRNDNDCNWLNNNLECQPVRDFGWSINVRLG